MDSIQEKAKTSAFIHNELYYKNTNPDELWVRLSDAQQEIDKVKVPLEYQVMVLQQWHDELKQELVVLLKSRPRKTVDEHLHGGAFHSYGACPSVNDYENWLQDFEKKLEEILKK